MLNKNITISASATVVRRIAPAVCATLLLSVTGDPAAAQSVADALAATRSGHDASRAIEQQIDRLYGVGDRPTLTLFDREQAAQLAALEQRRDALRARSSELETAIGLQQEAAAGLMPLLTSMLNVLERAIGIGPPVDAATRLAALSAARDSLRRHDLTVADRYAAVLGAYQRELRYSYDSGVSSATVVAAGGERLVTLLRIGRIALYYVTADASHCGVWSDDQRDFLSLAAADCVLLTTMAAASDPGSTLGVLPLAGDAP